MGGPRKAEIWTLGESVDQRKRGSYKPDGHLGEPIH